MRNNEGRIGAAQAADAPPTNVSKTPAGDSNLLNFVIPTDFVELPSKGKFYPEGHPLHNKDHVEIRQMTAKDEDILTSRGLLQKGIAIDRLIENLLIDKNIRCSNLLVGDKNAIMMTARVSAYGGEYNTTVRCPVCTQTSEHSFDLSKITWQTPDNIESEAKLTSNLTYSLTLPTSKVTAEVKFLTSAEEKKLVELSERKKQRNMLDTPVTDQLKTFIVSINGNTDKSDISGFVDNMPARDSRFLRTEYVKLVPNVDLTQDFICKHCLSESTMEVPFTTDFFWPR